MNQSRTESDDVPAEYQIAASSRQMGGRAVPTLRVVRLSDRRVIYPFPGYPDMPYFNDREAARQYARDYGAKLVHGDMAVPE